MPIVPSRQYGERMRSVAEYLHGGDIYSQETELDYSANISPLGLPDGVRQAVMAGLDSFSVYPDSQCRKLIKALAVHHGVKEERIICGNGAADLIFQIIQAVKPKKALLTAPSFLEYEQALKAAGTRIVTCVMKKEEGFQLDPERWISMLDSSINIAFLCNPNNPTGFALPKETVKKMAEACSRNRTVLVVDECFNEFLDDPEASSVLESIEDYQGLFVLKAFTKLYAMAGFRLGYGITGSQELISAMEAVRQPWSVSGIAQEAGTAALKEKDYVSQVRLLVREEREYLKKGLSDLSFTVYDSKANYLFFWVPDDEDGENSLYEKMKKRKILIRSCHNYEGLQRGYYRICVKDRKSNEKLLTALEDIR